MPGSVLQLLITVAILPVISLAASPADGMHKYRASPKLTGPVKLLHDPEDTILNTLDGALEKISTIYMQALFAGTHTPELEAPLRALEMELFDLLDELYNQNRLKDYIKYEAEVTRQMIIYNMLKRLFGYTQEVEAGSI
ncbi:uncharacterized protein LOC6528556 [Drosophila yakuba]|uniref:Uncharacterized protein n=1 Tax=Drosophila yakuba TaxID=7245 RepID=B4P2Q1_DROYA|nr:uncharacterized protein LOC6528556 [Drosophila yakuba]EDW89312.2 uncharacterized protein Dyak_GE23207 [Drosophila yakuba]